MAAAGHRADRRTAARSPGLADRGPVGEAGAGRTPARARSAAGPGASVAAGRGPRTGAGRDSRAAAGRGRRPADDGAAVVDFALVGALLTLVFVAVVQLAVILHVRNTLVDCASDGARFGALADRDPQAGAARARELITADLSAAYAGSVTAGRERFGGVDTVVVTVRAPLPVAGLLGVGRVLTVSGHALAAQGPA